MTSGDPEPATSPPVPAIPRSSLVAITVLAVLVLAAAVTANVLVATSHNPADLAIFTTAAITSSAAAVNVVLSYFVLLTTQRQLAAITANSAAERQETAAQLELTRKQLTELRTQAEQAQSENAEARNLTLSSNRESLRARLDTLAPRVTMRRAAPEIRYFPDPQVPQYLSQVPEVAELENSSGLLVVHVPFIIRNWGDEPVTLMLPYPWSDKLNYYYVLDPGTTLAEGIERDFSIPLENDGLRRYARDGWPGRGAENPWHWTISVSVTNVSFDVQDDLVWSGSIQLYHMNDTGRIERTSGRVVNDVPIGHRKRTYSHLTAEESAPSSDLSEPHS